MLEEGPYKLITCIPIADIRAELQGLSHLSGAAQRQLWAGSSGWTRARTARSGTLAGAGLLPARGVLPPRDSHHPAPVLACLVKLSIFSNLPKSCVLDAHRTSWMLPHQVVVHKDLPIAAQAVLA